MPWNPPNIPLNSMTDANWQQLCNPATPRFFLTGDGHTQPCPFQWAVRLNCPAMRQHFVGLAQQNQLYLHVEQFPRQVNNQSVPAQLAAAVANNCVFGWEPPIMELVLETMEQIQALKQYVLGGETVGLAAVQQVAQLDHSIGRVIAAVGAGPAGIPADCDARVSGAAAIWGPVKAYLGGVHGTEGWAAAPGLGAAGLSGLGMAQATRGYSNVLNKPQTVLASDLMHISSLMKIYDGLDSLRILMNPTLGAGITQKIQQFPNHTHLITCGFTHLLENPLQNYIQIGNNVGIVDTNTTR